MQIVAPSACSSRSSSITASPFFESRLPVGSSASRIDGLAAHRPRHRHALLLAAGELRRANASPGAPCPRVRQRLVHPRPRARRGQPAIGQRQLDVLPDRQVADEIEALEDEADLAVAHPGALGWFNCATGSPRSS